MGIFQPFFFLGRPNPNCEWKIRCKLSTFFGTQMDLFRPEASVPCSTLWTTFILKCNKQRGAFFLLPVSLFFWLKSREANKKPKSKTQKKKGGKLAAKNAKQIDWNRKRSANENDSNDWLAGWLTGWLMDRRTDGRTDKIWWLMALLELEQGLGLGLGVESWWNVTKGTWDHRTPARLTFDSFERARKTF